MSAEVLGIFVFALVCYVVAEVVTEFVDALVWVWRGKRPPE